MKRIHLWPEKINPLSKLCIIIICFMFKQFYKKLLSCLSFDSLFLFTFHIIVDFRNRWHYPTGHWKIMTELLFLLIPACNKMAPSVGVVVGCLHYCLVQLKLVLFTMLPLQHQWHHHFLNHHFLHLPVLNHISSHWKVTSCTWSHLELTQVISLMFPMTCWAFAHKNTIFPC